MLDAKSVVIFVTNRVISDDIKSCTYCCFVICTKLLVLLYDITQPKIGATHYHTQLGLPDKGHAIKGLLLKSYAFEPAKWSDPGRIVQFLKVVMTVTCYSSDLLLWLSPNAEKQTDKQTMFPSINVNSNICRCKTPLGE